MSRDEQLARLRELVMQHRWAALASQGKNGQPEGSMVAYTFNETLSEVYLHLSELAAHTRNLQQHPQASLIISECDNGESDPQQLARAIITGKVSRMEPADSSYDKARRQYLSRLPDAEPLFSFGDFRLFCFRPEKIRFVGGFAQAYTVRPEELSGS